MKTLNTLLLLLMVSLTFNVTSFAQDKDPTIIYFYRHQRTGSTIPVDISLNDNGVGQIRNKSAIKYKIYSEGKIDINFSSFNGINTINSKSTINVKAGSVHYFEVSMTLASISINLNPSNSENVLKKINSKRFISLSEDIDSPIIEKPSEQRLAITNDKQIVYIEKPNDEYKYLPVSDISKNIPENNNQSDLSFALIIGNEDYASYQTDLSKEMNVEFARNDASAFREYAIKTLGIPERNITFLLDGTYGQISQALSKMNLISKSTNGKATLYFYYAGHGLPEQNTRESYIMPVDISGSNLQSAINLKDVYSKLTEHPSEKVIVFLDACFTGGGREQGLLSARAVRVRPREDLLKGNLTVFASSSGEQTSLPYREKQHGLFTYYLLKKIQETKGELTLKELSDYLTDKVSLESIIINNREQTPKTNISHEIENKWQDWKLIKK